MVRRRFVVLLLVLAGSAAYLGWLSNTDRQDGAAAPASSPGARPAAPQRYAELPPRPAIGEARGDAFATRQWTPESPAPSSPKAAAIAPPPQPPMPYRYAGKLVLDGAEQILLANGDTIFPVRAGETLEGGYRVESIDADWILLRHLSQGTRHQIPVSSVLEPEIRR
jgi:hypothetical protein